MFTGTAKIELSEQTLIVALNEYFARRLRPGHVPTVTSVRTTANTFVPNVTFTLELKEPTVTLEEKAKEESYALQKDNLAILMKKEGDWTQEELELLQKLCDAIAEPDKRQKLKIILT